MTLRRVETIIASMKTSSIENRDQETTFQYTAMQAISYNIIRI